MGESSRQSTLVVATLAFLITSAPPVAAQLTFTQTWGWQGDARQDAAAMALTNTVNRFNAYGDFSGGNGNNVEAAYNPGVPTAQANYGGWGGIIEYGGTWPNDRVTQHELNHWLGTGTYSNANGLGWDGPRTLEIFEQFEGVGARLGTDGIHFWPYGLNYDNEWSELNAQRNVALTYALRADWGIGSTANPAAWNATSVSLTSSDPAGTSGSQSRWHLERQHFRPSQRRLLHRRFRPPHAEWLSQLGLCRQVTHTSTPGVASCTTVGGTRG